MSKELYATISVAKENEKKEVKIYKTKAENFGIEINEKVNSEEKDVNFDNITSKEEKIDDLLNKLIFSVADFQQLEYIAEDFSDKKITV